MKKENQDDKVGNSFLGWFSGNKKKEEKEEFKQSELDQAQADLAKSVISTVSDSDRSDVSMVK